MQKDLEKAFAQLFEEYWGEFFHERTVHSPLANTLHNVALQCCLGVIGTAVKRGYLEKTESTQLLAHGFEPVVPMSRTRHSFGFESMGEFFEWCHWAERMNATNDQIGILFKLLMLGEREMRPAYLMAKLNISRSSMDYQLQQLHQKGLIAYTKGTEGKKTGIYNILWIARKPGDVYPARVIRQLQEHEAEMIGRKPPGRPLGSRNKALTA